MTQVPAETVTAPSQQGSGHQAQLQTGDMGHAES